MTVDTKGRARQRQIEAHDRQMKALELRKAGVEYEKIAQIVGYNSKQAAWKAVGAALKATLREPSDAVRGLELDRIDKALASIWPQVLQGSLGAVDRFIRLSERRARFLGLDAPQKIAPTDPSGENEWTGKGDTELIRDFERLLDAARARAGAGDSGGTQKAGG